MFHVEPPSCDGAFHRVHDPLQRSTWNLAQPLARESLRVGYFQSRIYGTEKAEVLPLRLPTQVAPPPGANAGSAVQQRATARRELAKARSSIP